jgi:hypothetical protein
LSIILAARELNGLLRDAGLKDDDQDLIDIVLIDSETDALPIDLPARSRWNDDALTGRDSAIREAERWAKDFGLNTCRRLISRLEPQTEN